MWSWVVVVVVVVACYEEFKITDLMPYPLLVSFDFLFFSYSILVGIVSTNG